MSHNSGHLAILDLNLPAVCLQSIFITLIHCFLSGPSQDYCLCPCFAVLQTIFHIASRNILINTWLLFTPPSHILHSLCHPSFLRLPKDTLHSHSSGPLPRPVPMFRMLLLLLSPKTWLRDLFFQAALPYSVASSVYPQHSTVSLVSPLAALFLTTLPAN